MDEALDRIRAALLGNQQEALRFIAERDDRIRELEAELGRLGHRVKALAFELSARSAAARVLSAEIEELEARIIPRPTLAKDKP